MTSRTYSSGKKSVARTVGAAVAQRNLACGRGGNVVNQDILGIVLEEGLPEAKELLVSHQIIASLVIKSVTVNDLLIKEIAEFKELIHRGPVSEVLPDSIEKSQVLLVGSRCGGGWDRLWHDWRESRFDNCYI